MNKSPISVVIPTFQGKNTIERAVASVVNEPLVGEVLIMDDGSTDGTEDLVKSFPYENVTFERESNSGACRARNRGLSLATGRYVLFLDADDYVEHGYIEQFRQKLATIPDVIIAGHRHLSAEGRQIGIVTYESDLRDWDLLAEYINNPIQTSGFIWNREWLLGGGGWDETLPIFQDAEISIRMLLRRPKVCIIARPSHLAVWTEHTSITRITNNITDVKINAMYRGLALHKDAIMRTGNANAVEGLGRRLYELARKAYVRNFDEVGDLCVAAVRELGISGHVGGYSHRILSSLIGLKAKMHLIAFSRNIRTKMFNRNCS